MTTIDHLNSRVQELERIVHALSTAPQSPYRSQRGGTYKLLDEDGRAIFYFGKYSYAGATPEHGILASVPDGAGPGTDPVVLVVGPSGLEVPFLDIPTQKANETVSVTSGTFSTIWIGHAMYVVSSAIRVVGSIYCDAGTTGEVQVVAGSVTSAVVSCPSGIITNYEWNLLTDPNLISASPLIPRLQVRRVSGTGNVAVYEPYMAQVGAGASGATATGL